MRPIHLGFRLRLRTMMVLVAVAALVVMFTMRENFETIRQGASEHRRLADHYQHVLDPYDTEPGFWMLYNGTPQVRGPAVEAGRRVYKGDPILLVWKDRYEARARYHAERAIVWDRTLWRPWASVPTDPPPPLVQHERIFGTASRKGR